MLKLAGENGLNLEKLECISYAPGVLDTTDMEAAVHTIVPTARPATGGAQYNRTLTLPAPSDSRIAVLKLCARLNVNITSLGTAAHVYCSVRVDADDSDHELFTEDWTATGSKLDAIDLHAAGKSVLFNLIKDGGPHVFYFLFWANAASQAQIDAVELWLGVGSCVTSTNANPCFTLNHTGFCHLGISILRVGTGTQQFSMYCDAACPTASRVSQYLSSETFSSPQLILSFVTLYGGIDGTVATDLNYLNKIFCILRSEE